MKTYFGEGRNFGRVHNESIDFILARYTGKTLYCKDYEKLLRRLGLFTTTFEDLVLVKFGKCKGEPVVTILGEVTKRGNLVK